MDAVTIFVKLAREALQQQGLTGPALEHALAAAEAQARATLGGSYQHISRWPAVSTKARVIELAQQSVPNSVIAVRLGVTDRYVRRIVSQMRTVRESP